MPVLPFIVESFGYGGLMYGILLSSYSLFQFLASPVLGGLSDRYGRKPILVISQAGTLLSWFIFLLAWFLPSNYLGFLSLPILTIMISRIVDGVTGGNISVATAYLTDIVPPKDRSKYFGLLGAFTGIGLIFGPFIGGLTSSTELSYLPTVIFAIILSIVTLAYIVFGLPESNHDKNSTGKIIDQFDFYKKIKNYSHNKTVQLVFLFNFTITFLFTIYTTNIVLFWKDRFNFSELDIGFYMLFIGIIIMVSQGFLVGKFVKRFGDFKTLLIGLSTASLGIFMVWISAHTNIYPMIAGAVLIASGVSLFFTTIQSLAVNNASEKNKGDVTGLNESLSALGRGRSADCCWACISTYSIWLIPCDCDSLCIYSSVWKNHIENLTQLFYSNLSTSLS